MLPAPSEVFIGTGLVAFHSRITKRGVGNWPVKHIHGKCTHARVLRTGGISC